jgi:pimeloyl-ACP methyl ester carboxylesterase
MREMTTNLGKLHTRIWGTGETVLMVHGSNTVNPEFTWAQQRELAKRYQLLVPDRRGYGASPLPERKGFEDNVHDILALLGTGAHLVGGSYGGVIALLAAAQRPELLRSLTVIEPPAFGIARDHPVVEEVVESINQLYTTVSKITPEAFAHSFIRILGGQVLKPVRLSLEQRKAILTTMFESPPWEAKIPLDKLATTRFPKLIISGNWHPAFEVVADILAQRIGAERAVIQGCGHEVQKVGKPFNERLEVFWRQATS